MAAMKSSGRMCPGKYNSIRINAFRSLICSAVALVVFFAAGARVSSAGWWLWLVSGVSNAVMMFAWLLCSERVPLVFVESFSMLGSVAIPLFLAPVLYAGESVSPLQWAGVVCLLVALIFLSPKPKHKLAAAAAATAKAAKAAKEAKEAKRANGAETGAVNAPAETASARSAEKKKAALVTAAYIVLLILSNAGVSLTQKLYPVRVGKEYTPFFNLATFGVVLLCFFGALFGGKAFADKKILIGNAASGKKLALYVSIAAVMIYVYSFFATLAAEALPSAVYYPLARGVSMLLTVLCDFLVFRQKITKNDVVGLAFILAAVLLTSL